MGAKGRRKQARLASKLRRIRLALRLSQGQLLKHLDLEVELKRGDISRYELGLREPPLYVILRYAKAAGVCTDVLIDDELSLPRKLPGTVEHKGESKV